MFNRAITIFLGKDNCHYTTKEKQTGTATLDDKSQVQFLSKKNPKMPFFYSRRNLYMIGFLLAFIVTLLEFIRGRHQNFMVFSDATQFFWQGISPYTTEFVEAHGRYFLYSPVFTVLFAPFAYLPAWLGTFRVESIQLFAVLYGDLHAAPTIHPAAEMPYVPFSVTDFRTKFTFISV